MLHVVGYAGCNKAEREGSMVVYNEMCTNYEYVYKYNKCRNKKLTHNRYDIHEANKVGINLIMIDQIRQKR